MWLKTEMSNDYLGVSISNTICVFCSVRAQKNKAWPLSSQIKIYLHTRLENGAKPPEIKKTHSPTLFRIGLRLVFFWVFHRTRIILHNSWLVPFNPRSSESQLRYSLHRDIGIFTTASFLCPNPGTTYVPGIEGPRGQPTAKRRQPISPSQELTHD